MDPNKPLRMIDPKKNAIITSFECIGSAGETISAYVGFRGQHIAKVVSAQRFRWWNPDWKTETGYTNNDTALE